MTQKYYRNKGRGNGGHHWEGTTRGTCRELGVEFGAGMLARAPYHSHPHIVLPHLCDILSSDRCRTQEGTCWCQHPDTTQYLGLSSTALTPLASREGQEARSMWRGCALFPPAGKIKGQDKC